MRIGFSWGSSTTACSRLAPLALCKRPMRNRLFDGLRILAPHLAENPDLADASGAISLDIQPILAILTGLSLLQPYTSIQEVSHGKNPQNVLA